MVQMELKESEALVVEAMREMDIPPANLLLWFMSGLEEATRKSIEIGATYRVEEEKRQVKIAREYMNQIYALYARK